MGVAELSVGVVYPLDSPVFRVMMRTAEGAWPCDVTNSFSASSSTSYDRLPTNSVPMEMTAHITCELMPKSGDIVGKDVGCPSTAIPFKGALT